MDAWAHKYKDHANFVCIGCAGPELAAQMGTRTKLAHVVNGYIEDPEQMPRWGQLGCNGFIVLGKGEQPVLESRTSAFMQVRELAFKHVEALVDALSHAQPLPKVCPGQYVQVVELQKSKELNGQVGMCFEVAGEDERCVVKLQSGRQLRVRPANLLVLRDDQDEDSSSDEGDDGS